MEKIAPSFERRLKNREAAVRPEKEQRENYQYVATHLKSTGDAIDSLHLLSLAVQKEVNDVSGQAQDRLLANTEPLSRNADMLDILGRHGLGANNAHGPSSSS